MYNLAKEIKEASYRAFGKNISSYELMKQLVGLKREYDWVADVPAQTLQAAVQRLETSYQNYFRNIASGEIARAKRKYIATRINNKLEVNYNKLFSFGKPKWAKRDEYNSLLLKQNHSKYIRVSGNYINIPKIGYIKMFKDAEVIGEIKTATIVKEITGWYICITWLVYMYNMRD